VHSIIHTEYVKASAQRNVPTREVHAGHERPHGPPRGVRPAIARVLAVTASRVDREVARRAVA
jgi:hypothetical protein